MCRHNSARSSHASFPLPVSGLSAFLCSCCHVAASLSLSVYVFVGGLYFLSPLYVLLEAALAHVPSLTPLFPCVLHCKSTMSFVESF